MNTKYVGVSALALLSGVASAQVPSTNDKSDGFLNTGMGTGALVSVMPSQDGRGGDNTAVGYNSLSHDTFGNGNAAFGGYALYYNLLGSDNTAIGAAALTFNNSGSQNVAVGNSALNSQVTGNNNTAIGFIAMANSYFGNSNTAIGVAALEQNSGDNNTATGAGALSTNYSGVDNTAAGADALNKNGTGSWNTASGYRALYSSTTANFSAAIGYQALNNSQSGLANIGVGPFAGQNIVRGGLNIDIGSWGSADESNTIRIGLPQYHLSTYISGIANSHVTGAQVYVTNTGQLGVLASSERYKTDITALGNRANKLGKLRPVSFHLKNAANGTIQYGLIAEEVDKVYPELVIRDNDGKIQGVRYDELAPMLLSQAQKQQTRIDAQAAIIASLEQQLAGIQAALVRLQPKNELVARR